MNRWVVDAVILIWLEKTSLLEKFLQLPFQFIIPGFIISEINKEDYKNSAQAIIQALRERKNVVIEEEKEEDLYEIYMIKQNHSGISLADASVIYWAGRLKAGILTGDRKERIAAEKERIEVHGFLWLLDLMVCQFELISPERAIDAVSNFSEIYLPEEEKKCLIKKWKDRN